MSTATMSAPASSARVAADKIFLFLSLFSTVVLVALVLLDGQSASAALIVGGFGLGIAFVRAEFSYTASWRRFLSKGDAGGLIGGLIVVAIAALAVVPVAALFPHYGGALAPLRPSLINRALIFRIGLPPSEGRGPR